MVYDSSVICDAQAILVTLYWRGVLGERSHPSSINFYEDRFLSTLD